MIKNERQYRITKAQAAKFSRALEQLDKSQQVDGETHPLLLKAEEEALRSQLADLQDQIEEYDALRSGQLPVPDLASFADLPETLIKARIAMGLSQRELADRLGLKEQQIQRYEATAYASASLSRVREVIQALGVKVRDDALPQSVKPSRRYLLRRLREAGLDPEFVLKRLIPAGLATLLRREADEASDNLSFQAASHIGRIYGWKPADIIGPSPVVLEPAQVAGLRFKLPARVKERQVTAYTVYAHYIALLISRATGPMPLRHIPVDPYEVRQGVIDVYGAMSLEHVLQYVWDLGVPVVPLDDPGLFHGACFREAGRNVIVVKQKTQSEARWTFDVLHELWHAAQETGNLNRTTIETDDILAANSEEEEEWRASQFAAAVILGPNAARMAEESVGLADHDLARLKRVVPSVARRYGVPVAAFAYYLAFHIGRTGQGNWWGVAQTLDNTIDDPCREARQVLERHIDFGSLPVYERDVLLQALRPWGE